LTLARACDAHSRAPILVEVEAARLDLGSNQPCERPKQAVKTKKGCDQIDERRLIENLGVAEQT